MDNKDSVALTDAVVDEVQRRMDAVTEAAVEWHQAEGEEWFRRSDELTGAIEKLLELRDPAMIIDSVEEKFSIAEIEALLAGVTPSYDHLLNVCYHVSGPTEAFSRAAPDIIRQLLAEQKKAMIVLEPSMPESGLEDACRQLKQAYVSERGNAETRPTPCLRKRGNRLNG